jgi:hypothetical protein
MNSPGTSRCNCAHPSGCLCPNSRWFNHALLSRPQPPRPLANPLGCRTRRPSYRLTIMDMVLKHLPRLQSIRHSFPLDIIPNCLPPFSGKISIHQFMAHHQWFHNFINNLLPLDDPLATSLPSNIQFRPFPPCQRDCRCEPVPPQKRANAPSSSGSRLAVRRRGYLPRPLRRHACLSRLQS